MSKTIKQSWSKVNKQVLIQNELIIIIIIYTLHIQLLSDCITWTGEGSQSSTACRQVAGGGRAARTLGCGGSSS